MKKFIFVIVCVVVFSACSDKEYLQRFADIKYTGKDIPTPEFKINGFYVESNKLNNTKMDSLYLVVPIFYKDGTCVISYIKPRIHPLMKEMPINLSETVLKWGLESQHWGIRNGLYRISDDTVYVTIYEKYRWNIIIERYKFKIVDPEHILLCFNESPSLKPEDYVSKEMSIEYTFVPADSIPIPDNEYLKKKKWFWENESDWKQYKNSLKYQSQ